MLMLSEDDPAAMLVNPIYAISIDPDLTSKHHPIISKERWIKANLRLIDELGPEEWLRKLLMVLEGVYPVNPNDPSAPDGYTSDV
jgi:hypothetical protein